MYKLNAIPVSEGYAAAPAIMLKTPDLSVSRTVVVDKEAEKARLKDALRKSEEQIEALRVSTQQTVGEHEAEIFEAHLMMIADSDFTEGMENIIADESLCAEFAASQVGSEFRAMFEAMDDEYMKARSADVDDITMRIIKNLKGIENDELDSITSPTIIIAYDLTPSETAKLAGKPIIGFITQIGGKTSHSAIMARSMGMPAISGVGDDLTHIDNGDMILLDGLSGEICVNPGYPDIVAFDAKRIEYERYREELKIFKDKKAATADGFEVLVEGNIGNSVDADGVLLAGGEGVGLFRSEFLFMDRKDLPSEEEQFKAYSEVAKKMGDKPVIIRTLDIGGDKEVAPLGLSKEDNPFLGYRAIRICLDKDRESLFTTQLRALLRASAYGHIKIMFPMISSLEEVREAKVILERAKAQLDLHNTAYNKDIEVGVMIEIPAAAIISDILAKEVDFFSIGTNDLIQYTCAVDRINEKVSYLYRPLHPGVLRLIKTVATNANNAGIEVGVCGETAGEDGMAPILCGLGVTNLSMSASSILRAKAQLSVLTKEDCVKMAEEILSASTAEEARAIFNKQREEKA